MTIGNELDQAFYNLGQRITRLEKTTVDPTPRIAELVDHEISARVNGDLERIEAELNDRIDEVENFDPDDLRCDLESQIEDVRDSVSYNDDRIEELDCYKVSEDEARDIAIDVVREEIDNVNDNAIGFTEWTMLVDRVKELEDRLNKPTLGARVLRWLREGPSAKEVATSWYASIRRGS